MLTPDLPENFRKLGEEEQFCFRCHPGVSCFTECCRQIDLALTPYDALRLSRGLGLSTSDFLERFALIEQEEGQVFPHVFLALIDDGRASCPFVGPQGCTVYPDRPGACRTYPLGRGACLTPDGGRQEIHVLLQEPHCKGFLAEESQNLREWNQDQNLAAYNAMNDEVMAILQHRQIKNGFRPDGQQIEAYLLALYNLDAFRADVLSGTLSPILPLSAQEKKELADDDAALLRFGIRWLSHALFG